MNKAEKFEIFRRLDSLFSYSDLLPDEFKANFIADLDEVRKKISSHKCAVEEPAVKAAERPVTQNSGEDEGALKPSLSGLSASNKPFMKQKTENESVKNNSPFMFKPLTEEEKLNQQKFGYDDEDAPAKTAKPLGAPPPPIHNLNVNAFTNYKKSGTAPLPPLKEDMAFKPAAQEKPTISIEPLIKKSSFEAITSIIIPKLTESGKKLMSDLSLPIDLYLVVKVIDDKSNLFKLFENYNKKHAASFVEFANTLYTLELDRHLTFIKTETTVKDLGIIKLEEILELGKVVSESAMSKGLEHQKAKSLPFIGKALMDLKLITENTLGACMKIQKWVSRTIEKAEYVNIKGAEPVIAENVSTPLQSQPARPGMVTPAIQDNRPVVNMAPVAAPVVKEEKPVIPVLGFIIPVFNSKGLEILESPEHKALADRIRILDGRSSVLDNYWTNRESFKKNVLAFLKFVIKLDSQEILDYKGNENQDEKIIWIRFGELLNNLGLISQEQIDQAVEYSEDNQCYIGEAVVSLGFLEQTEVDECLKVQQWINNVLSKVSYERAFVDAIQSVLKQQFKCNVDIGLLRQVAFQKPLKDIVYIKYNISGKLNGKVYYISDRAFMQSLANTLMNSVGNSSQEFDESYVATVCTVIISNSLTKLAQMGMFSTSEIPRIIMEKEVTMDKEIVVADRNTISMIPLINDHGRFAIGLELA